MQLKKKFLVKCNDKRRMQEPVDVGQEAEHSLHVLHLREHLGPNDRVVLEHLENEDRGPAEDKDRDHHDKHRDDGLHVHLGTLSAENQA